MKNLNFGKSNKQIGKRRNVQPKPTAKQVKRARRQKAIKAKEVRFGKSKDYSYLFEF
ncbi:MAG: hypothetical protein V1686_01065 [Patescibacteria group bacterium]